MAADRCLCVPVEYASYMDGTPRAIVEEFFDRMEDDTERQTVGELFDEETTITLPGVTFRGKDAADEMLEWLEPRYEWAAKEFEHWVETNQYVISQGSLYGVDNDGNEFAEVRYVDIYRVEDGLIQRVDIYNDLAATGVVE